MYLSVIEKSENHARCPSLPDVRVVARSVAGHEMTESGLWIADPFPLNKSELFF